MGTRRRAKRGRLGLALVAPSLVLLSMGFSSAAEDERPPAEEETAFEMREVDVFSPSGAGGSSQGCRGQGQGQGSSELCATAFDAAGCRSSDFAFT